MQQGLSQKHYYTLNIHSFHHQFTVAVVCTSYIMQCNYSHKPLQQQLPNLLFSPQEGQGQQVHGYAASSQVAHHFDLEIHHWTFIITGFHSFHWASTFTRSTAVVEGGRSAPVSQGTLQVAINAALASKPRNEYILK